MSNTIYCTYLTVYKGNKFPPFYIGSTSIENINKGYRGSVSSKKYKKLWISELKNNPELFETQILSTHETREEAFEEEVRYQIEHNVVASKEYINMAVANKKLLFTKDHNDLERNKKISESLTGIKRSEETRKKISENQKKRFESEVERKKCSERTKKQMSSEEARKNASEFSKELWKTEEFREKQSKSWTEDRRRKQSETNKKRWESEEFRENQSKKQKGKPKSAEARKKMSEAQKNRYKSEIERKKSSEAAKNRRKKEINSSNKDQLSQLNLT
jgi:hypothetical protein